MASEIRTNIVGQISTNKFSITSDGWQKPSKFPALLSITTHTINDDFQRIDSVLAAIEVVSEHTGDEISRLIEECLCKNGLEMSSIVACVRDDARNMQKSCRLLGIDSFQCSAHMYHLTVRDALHSNDLITKLIATVRKWVGGTHRSNLGALLKKFQGVEGLPQKKIPMDVCTRWNSTFLMMSAFFEMKNALLRIDDYLREIAELQRKPTNLTQTEWTNLKRLSENTERIVREDFAIIGELCKFLKVFHVETCRLSQEQSTASAYIPTAKKILNFLREKPCRNVGVKAIVNNLAENLQTRLASVELNKILKVSMLVDPRFAFDEEFLFTFEWEMLEDEFIHFSMRENETDMVPVSVETDVDEHAVEIETFDEDSMDVDLWARNIKSPSVMSQKSTDSQRELKAAYKAEFNLFRHGIERPGRNDDIFDWWRKSKFRFPLIAEGAKKFLTVPATSVSSERTFSMAGLLYANTLRNRLGATMAENLLLIKASLKKTLLAPAVEPDEDETDLDENGEIEIFT